MGKGADTSGPGNAADLPAPGQAAVLETLDDGYASIGDLGYVDEDGYLHVAARRVNLFIGGGAKVIPRGRGCGDAAHAQPPGQLQAAARL